MIVAIGDIHGHYAQLESLMSNLAERLGDFSEHRFVFLGDYVDGGSDSKRCVDYIMDFQTRNEVVCLLGNHETMFMDALNDPNNYHTWNHWYLQGGRATLASYTGTMAYGNNDIIQLAVPSEHVTWIKALPLALETEHFIFVHAGLLPDVPYSEHRKLKNLTEVVTWIREPFIETHYDWGKRVIFGHTYHPEPVVHPNKIGIDTMLHERGHVTAVLLDESRPEWYEFVESK